MGREEGIPSVHCTQSVSSSIFGSNLNKVEIWSAPNFNFIKIVSKRGVIKLTFTQFHQSCFRGPPRPHISTCVHSEKKRSQNGSSEAPFLSVEQTPLWHYFGSSLQRGAIFQNGSSEAPVWLHFFSECVYCFHNWMKVNCRITDTGKPVDPTEHAEGCSSALLDEMHLCPVLGFH